MLAALLLSVVSFGECGGGEFGSYFGIATVGPTYVSAPVYISSGYLPTYSYVDGCSTTATTYSSVPTYYYPARTTTVYVDPNAYAPVYFNIYNLREGDRLWIRGAEHPVTATGSTPLKLKTTAVRMGPYYWFDFVVKGLDGNGDAVTLSKTITTSAGSTVRVDIDTFPITARIAGNTKPSLDTAPKPPAPKPQPSPTPTPRPRDELPELERNPPEDDPATLQLDMPREARVWVDGKLVKDGKKTLKTPPLDPKTSYKYEVRVEYDDKDENGEAVTVTATKHISFKSGDNLLLTKNTFAMDQLVAKKKDGKQFPVAAQIVTRKPVTDR
jgi:uncharacterized protein (TIGR03000 family)